MSGIQKKLDSLQPHVIGIRLINGVNIVDAVFKEGWKIPKSELIEFEKGESDEPYYMFYSAKKDIGVDELLEYVSHVININVEREMKFELLKNKVEELKELFNKTPLDQLKTLKFTISSNLVAGDISTNDISIDDKIYNPPNKPEINKDSEMEDEKNLSKENAEKAVREKAKEKLPDYTPPKDDEIDAPMAETEQEIVHMHNDIELPPKNKKIEVETHDLPPEMTEGECNCGPDEACPKCIDKKGF